MAMANVDASNDAREQAKAQLESIREMLARLDHIRECDGDLDECESEYHRIVGLSVWQHPELMFDDYHDEDAAREAIDEDPLSVEVRSAWHGRGEDAKDAEFSILLCTGGPAVRIRGELDQYGQADRAWLEYQDWGTPWTEYHAELGIQDSLLEYANQFLGG